MSVETEGEQEPAGDTRAQWIVEEFTAISDPVPSAVRLEGLPVSISDLVESITAFREQKSLLEQLDTTWPAVLLFSSDDIHRREGRYVPLDLGTVNSNSSTRRQPTLRDLQTGIPQHHAAHAADRAGLKVSERNVHEVTRSFIEIVGRIIWRRRAGPAGLAGGPPSELFTVTTDSNRIEVLFANGYFLSTRQGFGFSTPASRQLPWGTYTFGAVVGGAPKLNDTLWTIPDVATVHLNY